MDSADSSVNDRPTTPRRRRWRRGLARTVVVLAVLAVLAWLAVPIAVRRLGEAQGTQALGRTLRIADAHFNPLTLRLRLDGVTLAGARAGAPDAATIAHVEVALGWRSLWDRAPVLTEVLLDAPTLRVARTGPGRFDFDDIVAHLAQRPAAPPSNDAPPRFAVYNIRIEGGAIAFDDPLVQRAHRVDDIRLGVPFVSNLPGDTEIKVAPRLQFVLDGARWDSNAQATPFRVERVGDIELHTGEVDLAPWLAYWPASLGWHPARGRMKVDAALSFDAPAKGSPHVSLSGDVGVDDVALVDAANRALAGWHRLAIGVRELRPFEQALALKRVALDGLDIAIDRDTHGELNVARAMAGGASAPAPAASAPSATSAPATPWRVTADAIDLDGAHIAWRDARVTPSASYRVDDLQLRLANVRWPLPPGPAASSVSAIGVARSGGACAPGDAVHVHLQGRWVAEAAASAASSVRPPVAAASAPVPAAGAFAVDGHLGAQRSDVDATVDRVALGPLRPYLTPYWTPATEGELSTRLRAHWDGALQDAAPTITVAQLAVDGLALREAGRAVPAAAWRRAAIDGLVVDLSHHQAELASLELTQPEFWVERDAAGALNVSRWVVPGKGAASASASASAPAASTSSDWHAHVGRVAVAAGRVHWRDAPAAAPVALDVDGLQVSFADADWPARPHAMTALKMSGRVSAANRTTAATAATAGRLEFDGRLGLAPLAWQGRLRAERVPLHLADPYLADASPLQLLHADFGWRGGIQGEVSDAGLRLHVKGDAVLTDLHTRARHVADIASAGAGADDLLSWQSLSASASEITLAPGRAPVVVVGGVKLAGAQARLVVTEQGHFNLTDLAPPAATSAPVAAAAAASEPAAVAVAAQLPASAASAVIAAVGTDANAPDIRIGGVAWTDARVEYTDRFVRPNYSADLTGINGTLGAFSVRKPDLAALAMTGRVAGTGALDIQGRLNPLAKPLALDVQAKAGDIELAPLSPYAAKYAGYAIERGKLSMDVHYKIAPDGRLEAGNRVVLNQLTFGEKVDSPTATKLPVLFAVALLKDRNGVIDVNLPIGGSINDPQFSVGGLVVRLVVTLLEKAVLSPFSLLAGSGESDLSQVLFVPGTARPRDGADKTFDSVAKALQDRPALQLTITGLADEAQEHADQQAANLEARLAGLRRSELLQGGDAGTPKAVAAVGPSATSVPIPEPVLTADDRSRLVKRLYADTKLPAKPRNVLGMAKDVPQAQMEAMLMAGLPLPADAARQLAIARALVVRDALAARGLPNERMFVASPKMHGAGAAEPQDWLPHAQLQLTAK